MVIFGAKLDRCKDSCPGPSFSEEIASQNYDTVNDLFLSLSLFHPEMLKQLHTKVVMICCLAIVACWRSNGHSMP